MTISKGGTWGRPVARPPDLRIAADDADLVATLTDGTGRPTAVASGDMLRTVNGRPLGERTEVLAFPIDLVRFRLDDGDVRRFVSHLVARRPRPAGGFWRGQVLAVMNAEWIGPFDVAPRGHPNDGRVETFLGDPALSVRQRLSVRRRLRNASHLPHPLIATRAVRSSEWDFIAPMMVIADGVAVGRCRRLSIDVEADATELFA